MYRLRVEEKWSYFKIGLQFQIDQSTARHHCKRHGKIPKISQKELVKVEPVKVFAENRWMKPKGKMYNDYVQEAKDRKNPILKARLKLKQ